MSCRDPRQAAEEMAIFRAFLKAWSSLERDVVEVIQPCQPYPDITVKLRSDLEIDFELGEWLNQQQMQLAKKTERLESSLLGALGDQGTCQSKHFRCVMMVLRDDPSQFNSRDAGPFRSQLFGLIEDTDRCWPTERFWHSPQGHVCRQFESSAVLAKYLESVHFLPLRVGNKVEERWPADQPWIFFRSWGGSYSSDSAVNALDGIIRKKQNHYGKQTCRPVRLLIYYGKAVLYNTPFLGINIRTFKDVAAIAAAELAGKQLVFERVYLFQALEPDLQAFEIYPKLAPCQ